MDRQVRKHLEMEKLFGVDFLPLRRRTTAAPVEVRPAKRAEPAPRPEAKASAGPPEPPDWKAFRERVLQCTKCRELAETRTQVVFGVGSLQTPLVFVGEAPGADEDQQGEPFVGRAGQLLTRTLAKLGVKREQVYIANILKCRPPGNRQPKFEEMSACMPYLLHQLQAIQPKFICAMGNVAVQTILNTKTGITQLRGKYHPWNNLKVFATFHPAYILRNMGDLSKFEGDLKKVLTDAGLIK